MEAVPPLLRELWRRRTQRLASNVATRGREHREIAHAAALIGEDYHDRFLVELIQNANDQIQLGAERDSTVVVVRTDGLLAVSNSGQVVTERNLERLSSLADSDKTGVLVGNKGVGFKAVYQVTDTPEVFSAGKACMPDRQGTVFDNLGIGFALERAPFNHPQLVAAVEQDIGSFFAKNEGLAGSIVELGFEDPNAAVISEFNKVAGFKYPLPRTTDDFKKRARSLEIPEAFQHAIRTLVVLPFRNETASDDAEKAIDRLVGADRKEHPQAELAILFLAGVRELVVLDHVRGLRWRFSSSAIEDGNGIEIATVKAFLPDGTKRTKGYWVLRADVLDCDEAIATTRRTVIDAALTDFGLEAWKVDDPLPVTVALPKPAGSKTAPLGPSGRFCLGLPTEQSTGLPAHVDARFFAKISRDGVNFDHRQGYNDLLLDVAIELLDRLLTLLRGGETLEERRAATLALHRPANSTGDLAERAYRENGIADGEVVLTWDGMHYIRRHECVLPSDDERSLLPYIESALGAEAPDLLHRLPEEGILFNAPEVLETLEIPDLKADPHPWLARRERPKSAIERSALLHRTAGPGWWEPYVHALLRCFDASELRKQVWLPVGQSELAAPGKRVFLPTPIDAQGDEEEVANVPPHVASLLNLVDGSAIRLRVNGRALTRLALRLTEAKLVRRPRRIELLEEALFPALESAVRDGAEFSLDLFEQAVLWIASMRETSRNKLDCTQALVPLTSGSGVVWESAGRCYLGMGWGLSESHERLLEIAYPDRRLVDFSDLAERFSLSEEDNGIWCDAVKVMGVRDTPRLFVVPRDRVWPLRGLHYELKVEGSPTLGRPEIDPVFHSYLEHLAKSGTPWDWSYSHDVDDVRWIEGLEDATRRQAVLDLMLAHPDVYLPHSTVNLRRVGHRPIRTVPQLWAYALSALGWPIFPGERGVGGEPVRVPATQAWLVPDGRRRAAYARLLSVVPHEYAQASTLLRAIGVWSTEDAPLRRLLLGLTQLATRLESERLSTRREALSLAMELFTQVDDRLNSDEPQRLRENLELPLLRARKLQAVNPSTADGALLVFDDDPARSRYIKDIDRGYRVPVARDARVERLFASFAKTWGVERVLKTSTAAVELHFTSKDEEPERFLDWLQRQFPRVEVAIELAAMLTLGGDRTLRAERISRHWRNFERLRVDVGSFRSTDINSFYDRTNDLLQVSASLAPEEVVAVTWELAGVRSRDLWEGYSRALSDRHERANATRNFLRDREISEVEIVEVADAAGLHRGQNVDALECALLALRCFLTPDTDLDAAAVWWADIGRSPEEIAQSLHRPELARVLSEAISMRSPNGELHLLRELNVPWGTWQDAVLRRDGQRYVFGETTARYRSIWNHILAVVRERAARDDKLDLDELTSFLEPLDGAEVPEEVATLPLDVAGPDEAAWAEMRRMLDVYPTLASAVDGLPSPPWGDELPIPRDATKRGVRLYREEPVETREIEASVSVRAVVQIAVQLAPSLGESVDGSIVLANPRIVRLTAGAWAHVYCALAVLRDVLQAAAPETVGRLSAIRAFHGPNSETSLSAGLPDLPAPIAPEPQRKKVIVGVELTESELQDDLASGSRGAIGEQLAKAASIELDPALLASTRPPLDPIPVRTGGGKKNGHRGKGRLGRSQRKPKHESELVGILGEALVHEWLTSTMGDDYGPDCWRSKARERYGFPACGDDGLGYDFKVPDPSGRLFGFPVDAFLIEVKSTSGDGQGPFPMSRNEWDVARQSHEASAGDVYIILRVFQADSAPTIGDVLIDPFAAHRRGEIRLAERDLWVSVAQPVRKEEGVEL